MRLVILSAFLIPSLASAADLPATIWPLPPKPPGISEAEFPVTRDVPWFQDFQAAVDKARSSPVDVLVDGDSLMRLWPIIAPDVWNKRLAPFNAVDFGSGHDNTSNLIWRLKNGELEGLHPKLIVLEIGQANIGRQTADIIAGIRTAIGLYREQCPGAHILLLGIFPRGLAANDPGRAQVKEVNQGIASLDDGQHVTFLDLNDKFLMPDGSRKTDLSGSPDFEGLSIAGYTLLADAIQPFLDKYCPKSSLSTGPSAPGDTSHEPVAVWPQPPPPPGPAEAAPEAPTGWLWQFSQFLNGVQKQKPDLIFDGDSITMGWHWGNGQSTWDKYYASRNAYALGISGDRVQHALWRAQHGELDGLDPKLVVLLIGTNNLGQQPADIAKGTKLLLQTYEEKCPHAHIILMGVFPRGHAADDPLRPWIKSINQIYATFASDRVSYIDIGDKLVEPDGTISPEVLNDYVHPIAKGYTIWAEAIEPLVTQYVGPRK